MARRWCARIKLILVVLIFSVAFLNLRSYMTMETNFQATEEVIVTVATDVNIPVPNRKGFLTIAIPTVSRKGAVYIYSTLESLINDGDNSEITIVILLADTNQFYNEELAKNITNKYKELVTRKVIHFVKIPPRYYPDFNNLEITFNDPLKRVQWRSKQNLDYAYVMTYSANLSQYYMQLEDDVIATERYLKKIKDFIDEHSDKKWVMLDFTGMGFIGKLYRSRDVLKLATVLKTFYNEKPCDFLMYDFLTMMLQTQIYLRVPKLFKHLGVHSSLSTNKRKEDKDIFFERKMNVLRGDNPPADLFTSLQAYLPHTLSKVYEGKYADAIFWSYSPKSGDSVVIAFKEQQLLDRIVIITGFVNSTRDRLKKGTLESGTIVRRTKPGHITCSETRILGVFSGGIIGVNITNSYPVACVVIRITGAQSDWILFRSVAIYIKRR
ncbi:alpha-1,3-mannosyl-glycoprotein 4-beta-N-acetylglucosaminyltransferase C [Patella vulgata]|uniref:alpha-1,3-mannosyl-glycoprotein 4-beta-N-acetylglucosaminyltransferase C n=1 Tax=Patella vulgata TaxID=6465 RepID=UPI0024A7F3E5|nr:alpha-1,3-mannosyl-glycoprotein 4-beta-N-acetylglucosaminyltransferase C [Patella vulgata]